MAESKRYVLQSHALSMQRLMQQQLHLMGLKNISAKMVEQQIIDKIELAHLTSDLTQQLPQADVVTLYKLFQVVARKN